MLAQAAQDERDRPLAPRLEERGDHRLADAPAGVAEQLHDHLLALGRRAAREQPRGLLHDGAHGGVGVAGAHSASTPARPSSRRSAGSARRRRMRAASSLMPSSTPQPENERPCSSRSTMIWRCCSERRARQRSIASSASAIALGSLGQRPIGGLEPRARRAFADGRADRVGDAPLSDAREPGARVDRRAAAGGHQQVDEDVLGQVLREVEAARAVGEAARDGGPELAIGAVDDVVGARAAQLSVAPGRWPRRPRGDAVGARTDADACLGIASVLHGSY